MAMRRGGSCALTTSAQLGATTRALATGRTPARLGKSQVAEDIPTGSDRALPKFVSHHRSWVEATSGLQPEEEHRWFVRRKLQLELGGDWDSLEQFRSLPKPKKVMGNEACHAIWPYPWLVERQVHIHDFTKSIYVYYPEKALTEKGELFRQVARSFSYEHLIPITFHNNQVYVETEMLVELSDTPYVVVNCIDGRSQMIPVAETTFGDAAIDPTAPDVVKIEQGHQALLQKVLAAAESLGTSVSDVRAATHELGQRPLQNGYVRVDYMYVPPKPEDRNAHLVQWTNADEEHQPLIRERDGNLAAWVNQDYAPYRPVRGGKGDPRRQLRHTAGAMKPPPFNLGAINMRTTRHSPSFAKATGLSSRDTMRQFNK